MAAAVAANQTLSVLWLDRNPLGLAAHTALVRRHSFAVPLLFAAAAAVAFLSRALRHHRQSDASARRCRQEPSRWAHPARR